MNIATVHVSRDVSNSIEVHKVHDDTNKLSKGAVEWQASDTSFMTSMNGSLTSFNYSQASLNLDSLTVADLDHFSTRSLPVQTSIARDMSAPWNESSYHQSLQQIQQQRPTTSHHGRFVSPPEGVSALDHLQNSISLLTSTTPDLGRPSFMIDEEENDEDVDSNNSNDDDNDDDAAVSNLLHASTVSLDIEDLGMDATEHRGNISMRNKPHPASSQQKRRVTTATTTSSYDPMYACPSSSSSSLSMGPARPWQMRHNDSLTLDRYNASCSSVDLDYNYNDDDDDEDNNNEHGVDDDYTVDLIRMLRQQIVSLEDKLMAEKLITAQFQKQKLQRHHQHQLNLSISCSDGLIPGGDYFSRSNFHDSLSSIPERHIVPTTTIVDADVVVDSSGGCSEDVFQAQVGMEASLTHLQASLERHQLPTMREREEKEPHEDDLDDAAVLNAAEPTSFPTMDTHSLRVIADNLALIQEVNKIQLDALEQDNQQLEQQVENNDIRIAQLECIWQFQRQLMRQ